MIIGLTSGTFDLIHVGHLHYLQRCRDLCDMLIVGVDSDEMVCRHKGPYRPIIPDTHRQALLDALEVVSTTFILESLEELATAVRIHRVHKIFKHEGFAHLDHVYGVQDAGAELVIVPDVPGLVSTSEIIRKVYYERWLEKMKPLRMTTTAARLLWPFEEWKDR